MVATTIHALSSAKNASGECGPEMYQTHKGNQYFGMKVYVGADAEFVLDSAFSLR